jgi:membrane protein required for colicin V production
MEGFTLVDGVVLAVIVLSAILAYARGLVRELLAITGWVAAGIVAYAFAPALGPLAREAPILRELIGDSCELGVLVGFAAAFAVALVIVSLFTPLLSGLVQSSAVGPIDQGLGLLFGVARGVLLVVIALIVYDRIMGEEGGVAMVDDSRSRAIFGDLEQQLAAALPEDTPQWVAAQYNQLTQNCE